MEVSLNRAAEIALTTNVLTMVALAACSQPAAAPTPSSFSVSQSTTPTSASSSLSCPPIQPLSPNAPLAARVNGVGIPLDLYNREMAQVQAAMAQQGQDPRSAAVQDKLKNLRQQVLDQVINDVIIAQQAEKEGVKVADDELNARLAQAAQDVGGVDKLNDYLSKNQISLRDLCAQLRADYIGEAMLNRVTSALPTNVEQVHARHILLTTAALGQTVLTQIRLGKDFGELAQQYSVDEMSKANGGDLGWFPRGVTEPQFEATAFQLAPGQVSDVVQTRFGYHIIKVEERESSRALPPEILRQVREQVFLAWLQAVRETMKIERLAPP